MHGEESPQTLSGATFAKRFSLLIALAASAGAGGAWGGLEIHQAIATAVFLAIILGTLFFWTFRMAIAFLGIGVLILTQSLNIPHFVEAAALPVILFLVGMMIVVGALRDLGFFTWVVQAILFIPRMTGRKFIGVTAVTSALLACAVDEVTSIIFIATLIFQVCSRLKVNPAPYIVISVMATNIGSAGTMIGNPVGIYIGTHAGLSFTDFIVWAFPIVLVSLMATIALLMLWYRRDLDGFEHALRERLERNLSLAPRIVVPYRRALAILLFTLAVIASHHFVEVRLGLEKNSMLLIAPLACAGVVMLMRRDRARHYVEREVDWWTILFFMLLFAIAGTLEYTGVTELLAKAIAGWFGRELASLIPAIMVTSALGSAFVDNVIFVAAFTPVIEELGRAVHAMPLWWAFLFGACFGGNITLIGSTANIVALGMLEKNAHTHIRFWDWLKIGVLTAGVSMGLALILLYALAPLMPK